MFDRLLRGELRGRVALLEDSIAELWAYAMDTRRRVEALELQPAVVQVVKLSGDGGVVSWGDDDRVELEKIDEVRRGREVAKARGTLTVGGG
jgi:uncharacterized OB-fold protein